MLEAFMINVDGAFISETGDVGVGIIIPNHLREMMAAMAKPVGY